MIGLEKFLRMLIRNGKNIYYKLAYPEMIKACDIMRNILLKQLKKGGSFAETVKRSR